jgi:hypothetical protein
MEYANRAQFGVLGLIPSPLRGPSGNVEFLLWLKQGHDGPQDVQELINSAVNAAHNGSEL